MNLPEFWDALNSFDWTYELSDDHEVWKAGHNRERELTEISRLSNLHHALYNCFQLYWLARSRGEKISKPPRPE